MEDNDVEWSVDKGLDSHLAFRKKDCSLAGVVSIQTDTIAMFQIVKNRPAGKLSLSGGRENDVNHPGFQLHTAREQ